MLGFYDTTEVLNYSRVSPIHLQIRGRSTVTNEEAVSTNTLRMFAASVDGKYEAIYPNLDNPQFRLRTRSTSHEKDISMVRRVQQHFLGFDNHFYAENEKFIDSGLLSQIGALSADEVLSFKNGVLSRTTLHTSQQSSYDCQDVLLYSDDYTKYDQVLSAEDARKRRHVDDSEISNFEPLFPFVISMVRSAISSFTDDFYRVVVFDTKQLLHAANFAREHNLDLLWNPSQDVAKYRNDSYVTRAQLQTVKSKVISLDVDSTFKDSWNFMQLLYKLEFVDKLTVVESSSKHLHILVHLNEPVTEYPRAVYYSRILEKSIEAEVRLDPASARSSQFFFVPHLLPVFRKSLANVGRILT